jgi:Coenzyme PQQ synthesis protein D (PqqD)
MEPSFKPRHTPDFQLEVMGDELLIYHPAQTKVVYCNATSALIWQLCDGERTVAQIVELLASAYPEAGDVVPAQTRDTLRKFRDEGVIGPA